MMTSNRIILILLLALIVSNSAVGEKAKHHRPWSYNFDNHIDEHQSSVIKRNGLLKGVLYIVYTGEVDPESGLPIARHPRGAEQGEECGVNGVRGIVGWRLKGEPGAATFIYHSGVNGNDHPVWLTNRVNIPTPGVFNHFH